MREIPYTLEIFKENPSDTRINYQSVIELRVLHQFNFKFPLSEVAAIG